MIINRRSLITGLVSLIAAPAIVRATNLMPVKTMEPLDPLDFLRDTAGRIIRFKSAGVNVGEVTISANEYRAMRLRFIGGEPVTAGDLVAGEAYVLRFLP